MNPAFHIRHIPEAEWHDVKEKPPLNRSLFVLVKQEEDDPNTYRQLYALKKKNGKWIYSGGDERGKLVRGKILKWMDVFAVLCVYSIEKCGNDRSQKEKHPYISLSRCDV